MFTRLRSKCYQNNATNMMSLWLDPQVHTPIPAFLSFAPIQYIYAQTYVIIHLGKQHKASSSLQILFQCSSHKNCYKTHPIINHVTHHTQDCGTRHISARNYPLGKNLQHGQQAGGSYQKTHEQSLQSSIQAVIGAVQQLLPYHSFVQTLNSFTHCMSSKSGCKLDQTWFTELALTQVRCCMGKCHYLVLVQSCKSAFKNTCHPNIDYFTYSE